MKRITILLLFTVLAVMPAFSQGARADAALGYTYFHANAPPAVCECFSMHGISGNVAVRLSQRFAVVGDIGLYRATGILSTQHHLTLGTYMFGPRVYLKRNRSIGETTRTINPWGQFLIGGAHASGSLAGTATGSSNGLAFSVGGGIDLNLHRYMAWRIAQPEFVHTRIPNGVNDRQNNFRLMTGIVFRLGHQR